MQKEIKAQRLSNIELLRNIAMFLVLVVHANFFTFGAPAKEELIAEPISMTSRILLESCSICCVNLFYLLRNGSG